jgi:hypothetical protein
MALTILHDSASRPVRAPAMRAARLAVRLLAVPLLAVPLVVAACGDVRGGAGRAGDNGAPPDSLPTLAIDSRPFR